jgi:hypothetical protein
MCLYKGPEYKSVQSFRYGTRLTVVERAVGKVMPGVLKHKEDGNLHHHQPERRERDLVCLQAEPGSKRVERPDLGKLDGKVCQKNEFCALPHLSVRWYFVLQRVSWTEELVKTYSLQLVLSKVWDRVDDHPRNTPAKVDDLHRQHKLKSLTVHTSCRRNDIKPVAITGLPM